MYLQLYKQALPDYKVQGTKPTTFHHVYIHNKSGIEMMQALWELTVQGPRNQTELGSYRETS